MPLRSLHEYLCVSALRKSNNDRLCTRRTHLLGTATIMIEEISRRGGLNVHGTIYFCAFCLQMPLMTLLN